MTPTFDPGLQAERTSLAWTRTALALALAGAVVTRLTVDRLGVAAVVLGLGAVGSAVAIGVLAGFRYRRAAASLDQSGMLSTDGAMMALASTSAFVAGIAAVFFVVGG